MTAPISNVRPDPDSVLAAIADYVMGDPIDSVEAYDTAHYCLLDTLGCGLLALAFPDCVRRMGPVVPGAELATGSRVPGTTWQLEPVQAAFNIGCMIRWLDFNDTWLAAEWGHPSDNLGGILAIADYLTRTEGHSLTVRDVLTAMIRAHEIQGVLALENSFNRAGLDHVLLVRVATTAVAVGMMGLEREQVINAVSNAWADGGALRIYRHAPNTGPRKSWAAGDATSRGVRLALMARSGELSYPSVLTAPQWGFQDALLGGKAILLPRPLRSYVMEHILFKISYPAEFHAQTAVECACLLHPRVKDRLNAIELIRIRTQESAIRITDKVGPLHNPADRDHCLQYVIAIGLLHGTLTAAHYEDDAAADPRIDALRERMVVEEDARYTRDYFDPEKRSIANAIEVTFQDGSGTGWVEVEYPIGHRSRRREGMTVLMSKFANAVSHHYSEDQADRIGTVCVDAGILGAMPVPDFTDLLVPESNG